MADGELDRAGCFHRQTGVRREALARPQGQLEARLQIEESDSAILELAADDSLGAEAQTVAIERDGALEIIDPQGE